MLPGTEKEIVYQRFEELHADEIAVRRQHDDGDRHDHTDENKYILKDSQSMLTY